MALTYPLATMGFDGAQHAVHPFFMAARDKSQHASDSEGPSDSTLPLSPATPPTVASNSQTIFASGESTLHTGESNGVRKVSKRGEEGGDVARKKNIARPTRQLQLVNGVTLREAAATTGDPVRSIDTDAIGVHDGGSDQSPVAQPVADLEVDANESRRKRQRTRSPSANDQPSASLMTLPFTPKTQKISSQMGLEEQLIAAAFGEETPLGTPVGKHVDAPSATTSQQCDIDLSASSGGAAMLNGNAEVEEAFPKEHSQSLKDRSAPERSLREQGSPPKKMIKLRTDGRLVSPKTKINDEAPKRGRPKKQRAEQGKVGSKLIVLTYGADVETRRLLGSRISAILSGEESHNEKTSSKPRVSVIPKISLAPPKATHPFFTGKAAAQLPEKGNNVSATSENESSNNAAVKANNDTHGPVKKGPSAASSWVGFGSSFTKPAKVLGSLSPIWPPRDMMHSRGLDDAHDYTTASRFTVPTTKKLKDAQMWLHPEDEVLQQYRNLYEQGRKELPGGSSQPVFPNPLRRLMTGRELQAAAQEILSCQLPSMSSDKGYSDSNDSSQASLDLGPESNQPHPAVRKLFDKVSTSLSPFDRFECENCDWAHKYSPERAVEVLQQGPDLMLMRDWLLSSTVSGVESGKTATNSPLSRELAKKMRAKVKRKRKRLADDIDDFIISSDDEADATDDSIDSNNEQSQLGSVLRRPLGKLSAKSMKRTKAIVVSGPHGCGKTAAVYAIAQELGFEVFEINAGTRRSGKDLLDKVGDMTRNHLVRQLPADIQTETEAEKEAQDALPDLYSDIESGRQSTMQTFFKASVGPGATRSSEVKSSKKTKSRAPEPVQKASNRQKQSLILLEEVDVLFEEDKLFWSTVLTLLANSKRPIIMTCTDPSLLPVEDLIYCAAVQLTPPPLSLAVDYLLLMAANEGHLLARKAVQNLYVLQKSDLRATITQLQFYCQMAVGDEKGGLEWMLIRSNSEECHNEEGEILRVVSVGTYIDSMGILPTAGSTLRSGIDNDLNLLLEAHREWDFDAEDWIELSDQCGLFAEAQSLQKLQALDNWETACDAFSAADIMPSSVLLEPDTVRLDASVPPLREYDFTDQLEGPPLLHTPSARQSPLSLSIILHLKLLARSQLLHPVIPEPLSVYSLTSHIIHRSHPLSKVLRRRTTGLRNALDPLSTPSASTSYQTALQMNSYPAVLTLPTLPLAVDIAPFVRSIALSDLRLEAERMRLSQLLSEGGGGRRSGSKKMRTTRASRAALEGGFRNSTRRERWWKSAVGYPALIATGGEAWGELAALEVEQERTVLGALDGAEESGSGNGDGDEDGDADGSGCEGMSVGTGT